MEYETFFKVVEALQGLMGRRNKNQTKINALVDVINLKVKTLEDKLNGGQPINKTMANKHIRWLKALAKGDFRNAIMLGDYDYRLDPYEIQDWMEGNDLNYGFDFVNWEEVSLIQPTVEEDNDSLPPSPPKKRVRRVKPKVNNQPKVEVNNMVEANNEVNNMVDGNMVDGNMVANNVVVNEVEVNNMVEANNEVNNMVDGNMVDGNMVANNVVVNEVEVNNMVDGVNLMVNNLFDKGADDPPMDVYKVVAKIESLIEEQRALRRLTKKWADENNWELEREEEYESTFERLDEVTDELPMCYVVYYFLVRDKVANVCRDNLKGYYAFDLIEEIEAQMINLNRDKQWEEVFEERREDIQSLAAMFYRQTAYLYGAK